MDRKTEPVDCLPSEALTLYRAHLNKRAQEQVDDFNKMPIDDRMELMFHMCSHVGIAIDLLQQELAMQIIGHIAHATAGQTMN